MSEITIKDLCEIIFDNAKEDREKALILYESGVKKLKQDSSNHSLIGTTIAKYLERSSKSNDQLLSLMRLLSEHNIDDSITEEDKNNLLDRIAKEVDDKVDDEGEESNE
ncbi:MAG: hypothetical protein ABIJ23_02800 [Candidatus Magasanikbacteria bacterium]